MNLKIKKQHVFILAFLIPALHVFCIDIGESVIVTTENAAIKGDASIASETVRHTGYPDNYTVWEIAGSGRWENNLFDKWVRISRDKSEWINYYQISSLPFVVSGDKEYNYYSEGENTLIIERIINQNQNVYFQVKKNMNPYYHDNIESREPAEPTVLGVQVLDNPWTRLYEFNENLRTEVESIDPSLIQYLVIEIENSDILLDYGVHVGMPRADVEFIFGPGYREEDNAVHYAAFYIGFGYHLYFYFENEKVVKIRYELEK